ncbi:MAG TPA: hypothetical protein VGS22_24380 [Thermoanaerobaculia bacterium]|jgi:hypothetical protein|nr:hypothetical protein [Thermoanaerobaculia bacterium]
MDNPFKRHWAELAPFRESVLVHFTRSGLRLRLQKACEKIVEDALELEEEGPGLGESWLKTGSRAGAVDLWHTLQAFLGLAATRRVSVVTEEEDLLCQYLEALAENLERMIADLERRLGPPPPELPSDAARRPTN